MNIWKRKSNFCRFFVVLVILSANILVLTIFFVRPSNIVKPPVPHDYITNLNVSVSEYYDFDHDNRNCVLPPAFPQGIPVIEKLNLCINKRLPVLDMPCDHSKQTCRECIPPWGGHDWAIKMTQTFQDQEVKGREARRKELSNIIKKDLTLMSPSQPIIIMVFNYGFSYLFLNYLCSLDRYNIINKIRSSSIIIVTDNEADNLCKKYGFVTVRTSSWLNNIINITNKAELFSDGDYKYFITFKIVYTNDLIHLGYNVIQQDIDIIYKKDFIEYFTDLDKLEYSFDIAMCSDGRIDNVGPGNAGFIYIKSNCKTLLFVDTLLYYVGLILRTRDDQIFWNEFLKDPLFRQLILQFLPPDKFVNGNQWGHSKTRDTVPNDYWMLHASWVDAHYKKVTKFKILGEWYLNESCPFYMPNIIPDHDEPKYYLSNLTWKWPDPKEPRWWVSR